MSSSGRRETVLIFCASAVKDLYLPSVRHYRPDSVHVLLDGSDDPVARYSMEFYRRTRPEFGCDDVTEHPLDISDYNAVLGEIIDIKRTLQQEYGDDLDIFINISSGTPEYSAAAMFASMLPEPCTAFRVDRRYGLDDARIREIVTDLNASVEVSAPSRVTGLDNEDPDEEMIGFLNIVDSLLCETRYPKFRQMIDMLKASGLWSYDPGRKSGHGRTSLEDREERYLRRHYMAVALANGWLERAPSRMLRLTEKGRAYASVYGAPSEVPANGRCVPDDSSRVCYDMVPERLCSRADSCGGPGENEITVDSNGRTYRIRLGLEQHR